MSQIGEVQSFPNAYALAQLYPKGLRLRSVSDYGRSLRTYLNRGVLHAFREPLYYECQLHIDVRNVGYR